MRVACLFLIAAMESAQAQTPAGVTGSVTDGASHLPVSGVLVSAGNGSRDVTGKDGSFVLKDLPPGELKLQARLGGYRMVEATVAVAAGELLKKDFELLPLARVSGRVLDKDTGATIRRTVLLTNLGLVDRPGGTSVGREHDGIFEIPSLEAGDYMLEIDPADEAVISYGPPAKDKSGARPGRSYGRVQYPEPIHLRDGEQRFIEMRVPAAEAHSALGTIEFPLGMDRAALVIGYSDGERSFSHDEGIQASGSFRVDGMLPGIYNIYAEAGEGSGKTYGRVPVTITDHDVEDLRIKLVPGVDLTGTIRMVEGGMPLPRLEEFTAVLMPANRLTGKLVQLTIGSNGRFHAEAIAPGEYWPEMLPLPQGYAFTGGLADRPILLSAGAVDLTFVLTSKPGTIVGTVRDAAQAPVKGALVNLAPASGNQQIRWGTQSGAHGEFSFRDVAPGKYRINAAVVTEVRAGETTEVVVTQP